MAWLISPILGFFFQPIVGMWSDTCKCRWGRRRPFIGAYIGIALLLNSSDLGALFGDSTELETVSLSLVYYIFYFIF
jgi:solute carrier family 45 protein 1/2/4